MFCCLFVLIFYHYCKNHYSINFFPVLDFTIHLKYILKHQQLHTGGTFILPLMDYSWYFIHIYPGWFFSLLFWLLFLYIYNYSMGILDCGFWWNFTDVIYFSYKMEHWLKISWKYALNILEFRMHSSFLMFPICILPHIRGVKLLLILFFKA